MKRRLLATAVAVLGALILGALLMLLTGYDPLQAYLGMLRGAFGGRNAANLAATLNRAVPIVGMGLAAAVAFRAGFFNIGGEFLRFFGRKMSHLSPFGRQISAETTAPINGN